MKYDVQLIRFGTAVQRPAAELRKVFPIDEQLAESIVRDLPKVVKRNADRQVAETIAKALRELGAEVECLPGRGVKAPAAGSLPPPSRRRSTTSPGMPELTLDFDAALRSGRPPPPPDDASPDDASPDDAYPDAFDLSDDDVPPVRPPAKPAPVSYRPPASEAPPIAGPSVADAAERRDKIVAATLLGLVVLAIGYRFVTHEPVPRGEATTEQNGGIDRQVARGELVDAAAYTESGGTILTAGRSKMNLRELVDKLYEAGAVMVWAEPAGPMRDLPRGGTLVATALVVELPGDPDVLDPIVGEYAVWSGRMANTISVEELESHDLGPGYWRLHTDLE